LPSSKVHAVVTGSGLESARAMAVGMESRIKENGIDQARRSIQALPGESVAPRQAGWKYLFTYKD
jgi:hypothetical protein